MTRSTAETRGFFLRKSNQSFTIKSFSQIGHRMSDEDSYLSGQPNVSEGWSIRQRSDHIPVPHTERVFPLQEKSMFLDFGITTEQPGDLYPIPPFGLMCNKVQWNLHVCLLKLLKHSFCQLSRRNTDILSEIFSDHHSLKVKQGSTAPKQTFQ